MVHLGADASNEAPSNESTSNEAPSNDEETSSTRSFTDDANFDIDDEATGLNQPVLDMGNECYDTNTIGIHALLHEGILCLSQPVDMSHADLDEIIQELLGLSQLSAITEQLKFPTEDSSPNQPDRQAGLLMLSTRLYESVSQVAMQHHVDAEHVYVRPDLLNLAVALLKTATSNAGD